MLFYYFEFDTSDGFGIYLKVRFKADGHRLEVYDDSLQGCMALTAEEPAAVVIEPHCLASEQLFRILRNLRRFSLKMPVIVLDSTLLGLRKEFAREILTAGSNNTVIVPKFVEPEQFYGTILLCARPLPIAATV